jgi:hypothetical protein
VVALLVRVWLPDRPGALGAVASRIGAVRGDLTGIDILERGAGRAIDELTVELEDVALVDLLVNEIRQVDGVDVEDVVVLDSAAPDPRVDALETAALLVEQDGVGALLGALVDRSGRDFSASWVAVAHPDENQARLGWGDVPSGGWLSAFLLGARASERLAGGERGPDDLAWASLDGSGLALVLGRAGHPFRARERRQLAALARVARRRLAELTPPCHPGLPGLVE